MINQSLVEAANNGRSESNLEHWGRYAACFTRKLPFAALLKRIFHRLLRWESGDKGIVCQLPDGERVYVLPEYRHVSWNLSEYRALKQAMPRDGIALDIGANLGCYSLLLGLWAGPQGKVFAFEPAPETYEGLQRHIELNKVGGTVQAICSAVSDICGEMAFRAVGVCGQNHLVSSLAQGESDVIQLPTVTIDDFCSSKGISPDLIKIDVEGFELSVLRGAEHTIRSRKRQLSLFVEMHPRAWPRIGVSKQLVLQELKRLGLEAQPLTFIEDPWSAENFHVSLVSGHR